MDVENLKEEPNQHQAEANASLPLASSSDGALIEEIS